MTIFTVRTDYLRNGRLVRSTYGCDANKAIGTCVTHMQINHYGADVAEVYDTSGANELHSVVKLHPDGRVESIPKRDLLKYETKFSASAFLQKLLKEEAELARVLRLQKRRDNAAKKKLNQKGGTK